MNYQNGKIYKLSTSHTNLIYIGSTIQTLNDRVRLHRCKKSNNTNSGLITKYNDFQIELIENYPCNSKKELLKREAYYIRLYFDICVNTVIPFRTKTEYYQDNKEKIKKRSKQSREEKYEEIKSYKENYRQNNREKIRESDRARYRWTASFGGPVNHNNNLLSISMDLFN